MAPSFLLQRCASSALVPALPATTSRYKRRDEGLTSNGRRSSSKGSLSLSSLGRGIYAAPGLAMCQGDAEITALQASATHRACSTSISLTLHWSSLPQNTNNLRQPHAEYRDVKLSLPTRLPSSFLKRSPVPRQKMHSRISSSDVLPQVSLDISVDERTAGDRPEKAQSPLLTNVASSNKPKDGERVGVLLLNLGGPESLEDVQPFLFNLFADPDIIRLPRLFRFLQRPLAQFISTLRAPKSAEGYAAIGGGSPLRQMTAEQADALSLALKGKNLPAKVYVGMRYWHPFTEEAISQIKSDGITRLVVLPLYPQFSISTSGSSLRLLENIFREDEYLVNMQHTVIPSWYQREGYVQAMANLIEKEVYKFEKPEEVHIFFSAHGVPVTYVEDAGDPYKAEMEECVELIMNAVKDRGINCQHTLAYQSRVGPVEWLKPYTDVTIRELGKCGIKNLLAVPVSFVSEHIETLEEIDMEYRQLALESGIKNWGRVPALGCEPTFIADLADAVIEALPYVGAMAVSNLEARQSLVPLGSVEELLATYDALRRELPAPVSLWEWGWTKSAETWNGRAAMLAVLLLLVLEVTTGQGVLHQWGILPPIN
jgi:ferrochelatase